MGSKEGEKKLMAKYCGKIWFGPFLLDICLLIKIHAIFGHFSKPSGPTSFPPID